MGSWQPLSYIDLMFPSIWTKAPAARITITAALLSIASLTSGCESGPIEICDDELDNEGDGAIDCADSDCVPSSNCPDQDSDGFAPLEAGGLDCDDQNAAVHPAAVELCDGIDNDCYQGVDEDAEDATTWYGDYDYDGYGGTDFIERSCSPVQGHVTNVDDCDDYNDRVHPGAEELCDELDNNCNGEVDEGADDRTWYGDADGDGFGTTQFTYQGCSAPDGYVENADDCNDLSALVYPGAPPSCDAADSDCDGLDDPGGGDDDGDGQTECEGDCNDAEPTVHGLDSDGDGLASCDGDCDDSNPLAARLDDDRDCDGVTSAQDCDDLNSAIGDCTHCAGTYQVGSGGTTADLISLSSCLSVGGNLEIGTSALGHLDELGQLTSITGDLIIYGNPNLSDISGLSQLSTVGGNLMIWDNPSLCQSSVVGLQNSLSIGGLSHSAANGPC
ncbi:MAG: hypothetical protein CMP23_13895 [Rickettsiales bacterium]|nr:hypothetical protein [Rickettsiales bacterium]